MINIQRQGMPDCLNKPEGAIIERDYAKAEVKATLLDMQHGKCCYCERKIINLYQTEREVEHYVPKSAYKDVDGKIQWHLANKWENLLYACRSCNSSKGQQLPFNSETRELEIIDPSREDIDPEDHIGFFIEDYLIVYQPQDNSTLGRSTIEKLGLQERSDLFGQLRRIKLNIEATIVDFVNAWINNDNNTMTSKALELSRSTSSNLPFASFSRKYIQTRVRELNSMRSSYETTHGIHLAPLDVHTCRGCEIKI